jgi:hypothetical protein
MDVLRVGVHYECSAGRATLWMFRRLGYIMNVLQVGLHYGCSAGRSTL